MGNRLNHILFYKYFRATTPLLKHINKSVRYKARRWHTLCCCCNRILLLGLRHARSRPNLNQREQIRFSETAHERSDQSHRDRLHTAMPDRRHFGSSSHDVALSDRMRRRQWQQWSGVGTSRHRNHRVSHMGSGSRPLGHCLFRPLWSTLTRSSG